MTTLEPTIVTAGTHAFTGAAVVNALGDATVYATGWVTVNAHDDTRVYASDSCVVNTYGRSHAAVRGTQAVGVAREDSKVQLYAGARGVGYDRATIGISGRNWQHDQTYLFGDTIEMGDRDRFKVEAYDTAQVDIGDSAEVVAYDRAYVNAPPAGWTAGQVPTPHLELRGSSVLNMCTFDVDVTAYDDSLVWDNVGGDWEAKRYPQIVLEDRSLMRASGHGAIYVRTDRVRVFDSANQSRWTMTSGYGGHSPIDNSEELFEEMRERWSPTTRRD